MVSMLIPIFALCLALQEVQKILAKKFYKKHIFIVQKHSFTVTVSHTLTMLLVKYF